MVSLSATGGNGCVFSQRVRALDSRIDTGLAPPCGFIAAAVNLAMMPTAQRDRELIADLPPKRSALRKAQMMGITGLSAADQTGRRATNLTCSRSRTRRGSGKAKVLLSIAAAGERRFRAAGFSFVGSGGAWPRAVAAAGGDSVTSASPAARVARRAAKASSTLAASAVTRLFLMPSTRWAQTAASSGEEVSASSASNCRRSAADPSGRRVGSADGEFVDPRRPYGLCGAEYRRLPFSRTSPCCCGLLRSRTLGRGRVPDQAHRDRPHRQCLPA